jgi:hypothetical protein
MRRFLGLVLSTLLAFSLSAQEINKHISFISIYDFLDELANIKAIELNSAVKPYSRKLIGAKLKEAELQQDKLTARQRKDLAFFLKDYNKEYIPNKAFKRRVDLFYYRDSLFSFTLNPILGYSYSTNQNGTASHRWNGAEIWGNVQNKFGFYFSLRDNGINNVLALPDYLTQLPGANYKPLQGTTKTRTDFDEARGGLSYGWKWGSISLLKDNFTWGNNYNGANIFSGRQPSYAYLQFKMNPAKWFEFNYVHGSLISMILDSTRIYGAGSGLRRNFIPKYLAASLATFKPCKSLFFSIGNSIVYADKYIQPIYLIPFMFYPSADHTMNGSGSNSLGENSQMFADISVRCIPKTHIYSTLFIDELNIGKMFDPKKQTNLLSFKAGIRFTNIIPNTSFTFEYTRTNPWVYVHPIASTQFTSNNYNLGHYLGQNSEELFFGLKVKPARGLMIDAGIMQAYKGYTEPFIQTNGINSNVAGTPYLTSYYWGNRSVFLKAQFEIINDLFVFVEYWSTKIDGLSMAQYTSPFYYNKTNTITVGLNAGF